MRFECCLIRLNTSLFLSVTIVLLLNFHFISDAVIDKTLNLTFVLQLFVYEWDTFIVEGQTFPLVDHFLEDIQRLCLPLDILKGFLNFG